jgi:hypothetical protein
MIGGEIADRADPALAGIPGQWNANCDSFA